MQVSPFNYISSDVFMPLIDWCPSWLPDWPTLNQALVYLSGNLFGVSYMHVYDPLALLKLYKSIKQIPKKANSEATFQQTKH